MAAEAVAAMPAARTMRRRTLVIVLAFVAVNLLMLWATVPGANLQQGADAASWYEPTVALYKYGAFVELGDPTKPQTYRGPVFPIFGAAMMLIAGKAGPMPIVYGQIVLLLLTGLMFRRMVEEWCPGWGDLGLALFIFNPNALATAHLVQSDTVFLVLATASFWAMLRYIQRGHDWRYGVATGALLGIVCLTRPTPQFLLLALPLVLPILVAASGTLKGTGRAFLAGLGGVAVAGVIALPWILHVHAADGGFDITPPDIKFRYVWDQIQLMDAQANGTSQQDAAKRLEGPGGLVDQYIARQGPAWQTLSRDQQYRRLVEFGYQTLLSYPPGAIARTLAQSVGQFLLGAGAGNYMNLFGIDAQKLSRVWLTETTGRPLETLKRVFTDAPLALYAIGAVAYLFVLAVRATGLIGFVMLAVRRQWPLLLLLIGLIAYFALVYVFVGSARYRLVIEPALLLLSIFGFRDLARWLARRKAAAGAPAPTA
ncbi:MAG: glycosyltransferase family 39 protein [Candidatus Eiseniibacteriota bacterium]